MVGPTKEARVLEERSVISRFVNFYQSRLGTEYKLVSYPEDDNSVPSDSRIDAIYQSQENQIHIEHTSVDLISSGKTKKRSLDPGFRYLEEEISSIKCPIEKSICVSVSFDDAKDVKRLKLIAPKLRGEIESFLERTPVERWAKQHVRFEDIVIDEVPFLVIKSSMKVEKVQLSWLGANENFLEVDEFQLQVSKAYNEKLPKLKKSAERSSYNTRSILLVESNDAAAKAFYDFCGAFAKEINNRSDKCTEVWTVKSQTHPILVWHEKLDLGVTHCVYTEDPSWRFRSEIETARMNAWVKSHAVE